MDIAQVDLLTVIGGELKKVAGTRGGEYAGACPFCGGRDRLRCWPHDTGAPDGRGRWACRNCTGLDKPADAIDFIRKRDNCGYREALATLGLAADAPAGSLPAAAQPDPSPPSWPTPPGAAWQERARAFCAWAAGNLWGAGGAEALAELRRRGLTDDTIRAAGLGYNPQDWRPGRASWGLAPEPGRPPHVFLPAGIVIPWWIGGQLWRVNTRRPAGRKPKYLGPAGFANGLYQADALQPGRPVILVESELCALSIAQAAGELVTPVATGSTDGARALPWLGRLAQAPAVLVALDADEPGEKAAAYWLAALPHAKRWRPVGAKDPNDMLQAGFDLRAWVAAGLPTPASAAVQSPWADPRPDLQEDSALWEKVLQAAHAYDGTAPAGVFAALSCWRCLGARWRPRKDGALGIDLAPLGDPAAQRAAWESCMGPAGDFAPTLRALLGRPAVPPPVICPPVRQAALW